MYIKSFNEIIEKYDITNIVLNVDSKYTNLKFT